MELNIRDWMMVIGVLLFLVIALDGFRRLQRDRKQRVRMSRQAARGRYNDDKYDLLSSDFPNGGKRVAVQETLVDPLFDNPFTASVAEESTPEATLIMDVEEDMPVMELTAEDDFIEEHDGEDVASHVMDEEAEVVAEQPEFVEPEEIIVMHILAAKGAVFDGGLLHKLLINCDCRLNKHKFFQRYEKAHGKGSVQFSLVNAREPGIFPYDDFSQFSTDALTLFMQLPGPAEPLDAFDAMVELAHYLTQNLQGRLNDEFHSTMTEQTLAHERQRICDYLQRKLKDHG